MKRVLWFSPLPPAKTDIANYTARIVPELQKFVELVLVHPDGVEKAQEFDSVPISSLSSVDLNQTDFCIYHIGNNAPFHSAIFAIGQSHPGIVVLHDRAINEFLFDMFCEDERRTGEKADRKYRAAMASWYGPDGLAMANAVIHGSRTTSSIASRFPLFETILHRALGVICHNPLVSHEIRTRFPKLPTLDLPLPYPFISKPRGVDKKITADAPIRLIMFGFMGSNRRVAQFLEAWRQSPWRDRFRLDIAGELFERPYLERVVAEAGLSGQVSFRGFLSEAALDELIQTAHMVINLRNPSMGEASGSQLRIWANGAASAVSDTGWYALLPDNCVQKISIDNEAHDLTALLADLAEGRSDIVRTATISSARLRDHDPTTYAARLTSWLEDERSNMERHWAESTLIESVVGAYAGFLPEDFLPPFNTTLLDRISPMPPGSGLTTRK